MNTTPTIRVTEQGPEVGVATARLLLQHALEQEETNENGDSAEVARKRAINAHTGASALVPPIAVLEDKRDIETKLASFDEN